MAFKDWQADYAAHGIATFPCEITPDGKKPLVKNYQRFGLPGSAQIAGRFADASALGFMGGRKNGITPLDVDSTSDKDLADAIGRHGDTRSLLGPAPSTLSFGTATTVSAAGYVSLGQMSAD